MKAQRTRTVIFIDFGGVYFRSSVPIIGKFAKKLGISEKKMYEALMGPNWAAHVIGKSDENKYWRYVAEKLNISEKQAYQIRKAWYGYSFPNKGMALLITKLKKKYTVAALSSIIIGWVEALEKKYKISNHFHEHHYTYDHGIDKPSEKFFLSAAKKMKVKPEDCIVVDDMKVFLDAVKRTGARTILFKNAKQLEAQLRKMGVEV